jgi:hypothetical protein
VLIWKAVASYRFTSAFHLVGLFLPSGRSPVQAVNDPGNDRVAEDRDQADHVTKVSRFHRRLLCALRFEQCIHLYAIQDDSLCETLAGTAL